MNYTVTCPCGFKAMSTSKEGAERWQQSHVEAGMRECGYRPIIEEYDE
jgi:hypothetical protein